MIERRDRFIILRKIKYSEADLIIHALGENGAKSSFIARGALRSKKRFGGGVLEPIHFVSLSYKESAQSGRMKILNEATLLDDFKSIRSDFDRLDLALYVIRCVSAVSLEGDENSDFLFNLTGHALRAITQAKNLKLLRLHFCLKLLFQQGVISIQPWMVEFLKINLQDSEKANSESATWIDENLNSIESIVSQYIQTADAGYT